MALEIVPGTESHLAGLTDIYNDVIRNTTAVYSSEPVSIDGRRQWLQERTARGYPVWVGVDAGHIVGFATFGDFRGVWPGYRFTVEHSVHVRDGVRGSGIGGQLLTQLIRSAQALDKHVMLGAVDAENVRSIRFHARFGFQEVARLPQVGAKFGRWLDLVLLQKILDARTVPPN